MRLLFRGATRSCRSWRWVHFTFPRGCIACMGIILPAHFAYLGHDAGADQSQHLDDKRPRGEKRGQSPEGCLDEPQLHRSIGSHCSRVDQNRWPCRMELSAVTPVMFASASSLLVARVAWLRIVRKQIKRGRPEDDTPPEVSSSRVVPHIATHPKGGTLDLCSSSDFGEFFYCPCPQLAWRHLVVWYFFLCPVPVLLNKSQLMIRLRFSVRWKRW